MMKEKFLHLSRLMDNNSLLSTHSAAPLNRLIDGLKSAGCFSAFVLMLVILLIVANLLTEEMVLNKAHFRNSTIGSFVLIA